MNPRQEENIVHRYLVSGGTIANAPRLVRRCLNALERREQAKNYKTPREQYSLALQIYDEIKSKGETLKRRAAARKKLGDYMLDVVLPEHYDVKIEIAAHKLLDARKTGAWGQYPDGKAAKIWDNKSALSKLDPDEAREESKRLVDRYGAHVLREVVEHGHGLHYLVATIPNVSVGELAGAQRAMFRRWTNFKRIQRDKQKAFPEILGDLVIMESPLAADGRWNVHLNILLVTELPFHPGLYEKIRRLWKFDVGMQPIQGDAGEIARAFNELLKYGARTVPEKSDDKASRHHSNAPAITEWPTSRFVEWFEAQQGFKRTRTSGSLYGKKVPKPEPRSLEGVIWYGGLWLTPTKFTVAVPLIDLVPGDNLTTRPTNKQPTEPP